MTPTNTPEDASGLLPCPWCAGPADIVQIGNEHTRKRGFEVRCLTWGCSTVKRAMVIHHPLEKARAFAIDRWNRRAAPTPPVGDVEQGLLASRSQPSGSSGPPSASVATDRTASMKRNNR